MPFSLFQVLSSELVDSINEVLPYETIIHVRSRYPEEKYTSCGPFEWSYMKEEKVNSVDFTGDKKVRSKGIYVGLIGPLGNEYDILLQCSYHSKTLIKYLTHSVRIVEIWINPRAIYDWFHDFLGSFIVEVHDRNKEVSDLDILFSIMRDQISRHNILWALKAPKDRKPRSLFALSLSPPNNYIPQVKRICDRLKRIDDQEFSFYIY